MFREVEYMQRPPASRVDSTYPGPSPSLPLPAGTIKATCLIETLPAAFEMDEFLYELRDHSAGERHRWRRVHPWVVCSRKGHAEPSDSPDQANQRTCCCLSY